MAINETFDRRGFERRLFLLTALGFAFMTFLGFARTYYLLPVIGGSPLRVVTHIHGVVMSLWVLMFAVQIYLIRSKNIRVHMRLGWVAVGLAAIIIPVGLATALMAAKYGTPAAPPEIPPLDFMIVPMGDIVLFAAFLGLAIYHRKNAANHKRLLLLTVINFLPPSVARIPVDQLQALGPIWFFGLPDLILVTVIFIDRMRTGKWNRWFVIGAALLIASHPFRLAFSSSEVWRTFAAWAVGFV
jgi:hypothetical protein